MKDPFARQAILLALLEAMNDRGSWCGETHLQKCAYFLQEGLGVPLELEFTLYKHGPFSFDLREVLGEMRGNFLIDVEPRSPFGSSLAVGEPGKRLKDRFPNTTSRYEAQVSFVADKFGARDVVTLERLGTALYVKKHNLGLSCDEQARTVTELKPHIEPTLAREAVDEVDAVLAKAPHVEGS